MYVYRRPPHRAKGQPYVPSTFTPTTYFGVAQLELTLERVTAGFALKRGVVELPLTVAVDTAGFALIRGVTETTLVFSVDSNGVTKKTGAASLDLTFGAVTQGFALKRGVVQLPLVLDTDTSGFALKRGVASAELTFGASTSGTVSGLAPRVYRAVPEPHTNALQHRRSRVFSGLVESTTIFGAADLGLVFTADTSGFAKKFGVSQTDLSFNVTTAGFAIKRGVVSLPLVFGEDTAGFAKKFGASDLGLTFGVSTEGSVVQFAPRVYRAPEPFSYPQPQPVSMLFPGLVASTSIFGDASLGLTFGADTAGFAIKRGEVSLALTFGVDSDGTVTAGSGAVAKLYRAPQTPLGPLPGDSRVAFFLPSAPPIFQAIVQGGTNQGFIFKAGPQPTLENRYRRSKVYSRLVSVSDAQTLYGAAELALTLGRDTSGFALKYGVADLSLVFGRDTAGYALKYGALDLPLVFGVNTAGVIKALGAAALELVFDLAAQLPPNWTLTVRTEDGTLTLAPVLEADETFASAVEDGTLTLTVLSEESTPALAAPFEDDTLTLEVREEQFE
jgi:hypothetical protein